MNKVSFVPYEFMFGDGDHIYFCAGESHFKRTFLVDTGFSLGVALPLSDLINYPFTGGYLTKLVLATDKVINATVFLVDVDFGNKSPKKQPRVSFTFVKDLDEPLVGIEFLKLFARFEIEWSKKSVLVNL